jgi:hypothetical protein
MYKILQRLLLLSSLLLITIVSEAQQASWSIKAHAYSSRQRMTNLVNTNFLQDTLFGNGSGFINSSNNGGFGRATFGLMLLRDFMLNSRVNLQAGLGYRQKGFRSDARYLPDRGYTVPLPPRTVEDNLFHYASSELSLQFRTAPRRTVGYLRLGQRLDYLLDFRSAFWGNNYGYFTQFDYNVFAGLGLEYSLNRKWLASPINSETTPLYTKSTVLFLEIEGTPLLFNIHQLRSQTEPFVVVTDRAGNILLEPVFRMQKYVRNTGFGVVVGVRF